MLRTGQEMLYKNQRSLIQKRNKVDADDAANDESNPYMWPSQATQKRTQS